MNSEISFVGRLSGDGECSFIHVDNEAGKLVKPVDDWVKNAQSECEDFDEDEQEEFLRLIKLEANIINLSDLFSYFGFSDKKCKITIKMEEV